MKYMIRMVVVLLAVFITASCDVNQPYEGIEKLEPAEPDSVDIRVEVLDHDTDERIQSAEILFDSTVVSSDGLFIETREEEDVDINVLARADGYQEMLEPRIINTLSDVSISIRLKQIKEPEPQPPIARFTFETDETLTASFDGSESSDPDGSQDGLSYEWKFGDGETGSGVTPDHTYDEAGSYDVTLTVTDTDGLTGAETHTVSVGTDNQKPEPDFEVVEKNDLTVTFDNLSSDPDGDELTYLWQFGDGETSNKENPSHEYGSAGEYDVTLTATDPDGASDNITKTVTVIKPQAPTANFTSDVNELTVSYDGSNSSDPDGQIVEYRWDFDNDGTFDEVTSSPTTEHTFDSEGGYTTRLVVQDNDDLTGETTGEVKPRRGNQAPEVKFIVDSKDELTVHFENQSSDPDGDELSYNWSFGDGENSDAEHPSHTYADPGDYEVTLTGTDPDGASDTYQKTVTVKQQKSELYEHEITIDASDKIWVSDHQNRSQDKLLHSGEVRPIRTEEDPIGTVEMTVRMKLDDDQPEHSFAEIIFADGSKIETPVFPDQSGVDGWTNVTVEIPAEEFAGQAEELAEVRVIHGDELDDSKAEGPDDVIFATKYDIGKVWFRWRIPYTGQSKIAGSRKYESHAKTN